MDVLLIPILAMVLSMAITPVMIRFAPRLGLIDRPTARKVHATPIPRVGGIGIVIGTLLPVVALVPASPVLNAYLAGSLILLVFGVWDDHSEIGHYVKFAGQLLAAGMVVWYGGLYVERYPVIEGMEIPEMVSMLFTVAAIVGVINALNHSDGLDGLAGGESLASLSAIGFIGYLSSDPLVVILSIATMGGILGFLRFNTHPARVFMGDAGSQFLGFTLAFLVIYLTQRADPGLSPAVVLLLLGLPIVDILVVLGKRISAGMNWFRATRNHLHHRLLERGFVHQESVAIIYAIQVFFLVSAILLRYQSDLLILAVYAGTCLVLYGLLSLAEKRGWRKDTPEGEKPRAHSFVPQDTVHRLLVVAPRRFLSYSIPAYLLLMAMFVSEVPRDFGIVAFIGFAVLVIEAALVRRPRSLLKRGLIYLTASFVVYLGIHYPPEAIRGFGTFQTLYLASVIVALVIAVKFSPRRRRIEFDVTPMDYLIVLILAAVLITTEGGRWDAQLVSFIVGIVVLFYACEFLVTERRERLSGLVFSAMLASLVLAGRSLL